MNLISDRTSRIATENAFKVGPYIVALENAGHKVVKCNLGEPDFPLPAHVRDEVKAQLDKDNVHYCDPQGILPLRKAVAKYIGEARGISVTADQDVVFPGEVTRHDGDDRLRRFCGVKNQSDGEALHQGLSRRFQKMGAIYRGGVEVFVAVVQLM